MYPGVLVVEGDKHRQQVCFEVNPSVVVLKQGVNTAESDGES
jgi:hypothetical protein